MAAKETEKMTIEQVADALGVSKTTVSRALSGKGRISEETRAKVYAYLGRTRTEPAAPQAAAQEDDPFLQEFWRCAMSLRRDQQEMLLRLMREMGGQR